MTRCLRACLLTVIVVVCFTASASARPRLEHICTIQGQQEIRITGLGLVVGLPGTGDGAKNVPTVHALRQALARLKLPAVDAELKNADNVAVVMVDATIPKTGIRRGQKIDAHISSVLGAKSLRGGRLLSTPLTTPGSKQDLVMALAGGAIQVEDVQRPTTGLVVKGVDLLQNVQAIFLSQLEGGSMTLLIDPAHASFWTASEVARVVNSDFTSEVSGKLLARPVGPNAVELIVPPQYRDTPVEFAAQVLDIGIDLPNTQARVVVNTKTGTVVVTGEVEISPVIIAHKNFTVEIGRDLPGASSGPFRSMLEGGPSRQSPQQLEQLVKAMNELRVPAADIIEIIRDLHNSGKLHAELIER